MPKTVNNRETYINSIKTTKQLKDGAQYYLSHLGLNFTQTINLYLKMIIIERGIPFAVKLPRDFSNIDIQFDDFFEEETKKPRMIKEIERGIT